jgi:hypothetical protein
VKAAKAGELTLLGDSVLATHAIAEGESLRLFLLEGGYPVRVGDNERDVRVVADEVARVDR